MNLCKRIWLWFLPLVAISFSAVAGDDDPQGQKWWLLKMTVNVSKLDSAGNLWDKQGWFDKDGYPDIYFRVMSEDGLISANVDSQNFAKVMTDLFNIGCANVLTCSAEIKVTSRSFKVQVLDIDLGRDDDGNAQEPTGLAILGCEISAKSCSNEYVTVSYSVIDSGGGK